MIHINGEIHSSKNSRQVVRSGDKVRVIKSDASKADEQSFAWQLATQQGEWARMLKNACYEGTMLRICFEFRRSTRRRFDYINMAQGICDALVKAGYIADDDADHLLPSFVPYYVSKDNPGCDFWIEQA